MAIDLANPGTSRPALQTALRAILDEVYLTGVVDTTPNTFTFTDVTGAAPSAIYTSNTITIAGINAAAPLSITGGTYSKNGGTYTATAGTAVNGDTVTVRVTSASADSTAVNAVLTIGGVADTYTVTTAAAAAGGLSAPVNTAVPTISGTTTQGQTLTGTDGAFSGNPTPTISAHIWQRDVAGNGVWTTIAGATGTTYALASADVGNKVRKGSTATNSQGSATAYSVATAVIAAASGALAAPANTAVPTVTGPATEGQTLTGTDGTFTGNPTPSIVHLWQRDVAGNGVWTTIAGASGAIYVPVSADVRNKLRKGSTATNSQGTTTAYSVATAIIVPIAPTITLTLNNTPSPEWSIIHSASVAAGDQSQIQLARDEAFTTGVVLASATLTGAQITAGSYGFAQNPLATGVWVYRTRDIIGGQTSAWSASGTLTTTASSTVPFGINAIAGALNGTGSGSTHQVTLTTTAADCLLILEVVVNDVTVTSVASSGLTWTKRRSAVEGGNTNIERWYAVAPSALSGHVITVTYTAVAANFSQLLAYAVGGANTTTKFDTNTASGFSGLATNAYISTTAANTMVIDLVSLNVQYLDSGFTSVYSAGYLTVENAILTSPQNSLLLNAAGPHACLIDSILKA